jgi:hypothetical protein
MKYFNKIAAFPTVTTPAQPNVIASPTQNAASSPTTPRGRSVPKQVMQTKFMKIDKGMRQATQTF